MVLLLNASKMIEKYNLKLSDLDISSKRQMSQENDYDYYEEIREKRSKFSEDALEVASALILSSLNYSGRLSDMSSSLNFESLHSSSHRANSPNNIFINTCGPSRVDAKYVYSQPQQIPAPARFPLLSPLTIAANTHERGHDHFFQHPRWPSSTNSTKVVTAAEDEEAATKMLTIILASNASAPALPMMTGQARATVADTSSSSSSPPAHSRQPKPASMKSQECMLRKISEGMTEAEQQTILQCFRVTPMGISCLVCKRTGLRNDALLNHINGRTKTNDTDFMSVHNKKLLELSAMKASSISTTAASASSASVDASSSPSPSPSPQASFTSFHSSFSMPYQQGQGGGVFSSYEGEHSSLSNAKRKLISLRSQERAMKRYCQEMDEQDEQNFLKCFQTSSQGISCLACRKCGIRNDYLGHHINGRSRMNDPNFISEHKKKVGAFLDGLKN